MRGGRGGEGEEEGVENRRNSAVTLGSPSLGAGFRFEQGTQKIVDVDKLERRRTHAFMYAWTCRNEQAVHRFEGRVVAVSAAIRAPGHARRQRHPARRHCPAIFREPDNGRNARIVAIVEVLGSFLALVIASDGCFPFKAAYTASTEPERGLNPRFGDHSVTSTLERST